MSGVRHNMEIVLASRNAHKIKEIEAVLGRCGLDGIKLLSLDDIGFTGEIDETGATFAENAVIKASVPASMGYVSIADDSGLEVDYLDKAPGVYSARYMGEDTPYTIKNNHIIELLKDAKGEERSARFVCVIACVMPDGETFTTRGTIEGRIGYEEKGENGFGYDPIFYLPERGCTTAELPPEQKNEISHRGRALKAMYKKLEDIL